uniref:Uncharacterized protein n=1 Tax=Romanomermis culicivorax TaxID=13658 RepID=A0A915LB47_ROMCU
MLQRRIEKAEKDESEFVWNPYMKRQCPNGVEERKYTCLDSCHARKRGGLVGTCRPSFMKHIEVSNLVIIPSEKQFQKS